MGKKIAETPLKVHFNFFSELLKKETIEELPATLLDKFNGFYVIDAIPEIVPGIATDDVVCARFDKAANLLIFKHIVQHSGNSTIRVQLTDSKQDFKAIRNSFLELGCFSEKIAQFHFSMEVPFDLGYTEIKEQLEALKNAGTINFEELWLSEKHSDRAESQFVEE